MSFQPRSFRCFPLIAVFIVMAGSLLAAPTVTTTSPTPAATVGTLTSISITFNEPVSGVDPDDLLINNEGALSVTGSGPGPYIFSFTQPPPGLVSVSWDFDHAIAGLGTGAFLPVAGWTYTLGDTVAPTIARIRTSVAGQEINAVLPVAGSTVGVLTQVEATFSEAVTGVDASDLLVNGNAIATGVTGSDAGPYVFAIPQPPPGAITFQWAASHGIKDTAPTPNDFAGGSWSTTLSASGAGGLVINEFLAANATSITDENTNGEDWIEIFNPGPSAVNIGGWALTNNANQPAMWVFPNRTISVNGYLVVFASGKDRKPASGNLHTNFQLNESGGYLALTKPDSPRTVASAFVDYPAQRFDYSYGAQTNGLIRYFARPAGTDTRPGTANGNAGLTSVTPRPEVSVNRGFFVDPFQLVLSCSDPAATIRFTIDGSDVTTSSPAYTAPLTINSTRVLRTAAFNSAKVPSGSVTHTYLFLDQVLTQPSPPYNNPAIGTDESNPLPPTVGTLPFPVSWGTQGGVGFPGFVTNLSTDQVPADYGMDPEIINDPNKYTDTGAINPVTGKTNLERIKQGLRELPILSIVLRNDDMFGAGGLYPNSTQKGAGFEKACSVEFILPNGSTGFATTCGIRIHGNASRSPSHDPKHGMKLNFKGDFGASSLEYQLFPDSPVKKFDDLILRGDFNSSWLHHDNGTQRPKGTRIRDAYCKDTFRAMGRAAGHHRYVNLFINGIYWGTYDPTEQENNGFAEAYYGGSKDDYVVFEQSPTPKSGVDTPLAGEAVGPYSSLVNMSTVIDNTTYEKVKRWLDVPQFIDYMLLHFWEGHQDWGDDVNKNWYAARNAKKGGNFKYLPWDQENLMWDQNVDRTAVSSPPTGIHPKLVSNAQYKLDFADRVHKHMVAPGGALLPAANIARFNKWKSIMNPNTTACESARWGDYRRDVHAYTSQGTLYTWNGTWMTEVNRLIGTYFPVRTTNVLGQLRSRGLYPTLNAAEIRNNATNAILGSQQVAAGTQVKLVLLSPVPGGTTSAGTIYYTTDGADPRVYYDTAGARTPTAVAYTAPITINNTTIVKARALNGTIWSALNEATLVVGPVAPSVRITEIMYNPPVANGGSAAEYVELQNTGPVAVNMGEWNFDGLEFVFPNQFMLGPGARVVLASNNAPAVFAAQYPGVAVAGYFGGGLDNAGERISLRDGAGNNMASVTYSDTSPWPTLADGQGYSLEIIDPNGDSNDPFNWKASAVLKGSPGQPNSAPSNTVRINEVLARNVATSTPAGAGYDFVELQNTGGSPVDISGWQVLADQAPVFAFPANTTLNAGEYAMAYFAPGVGIADQNAQVIVRTVGGAIVDGVRFGSQVPDSSIGRVAGAWTLCTPTPAAANAAATLAPVTNLAINEWLANRFLAPSDWMELYNKHATLPVALGGLYVKSGTNLVRYPALSFLAPQAFVKLDAKEGAGPADLDLTLPAEGTTLQLLDANTTVFDTISYGAQAADITSGRLPDGTGAITAFNGSPSPGAANFLLSSYTGPVLNEVQVRNVSTTLTPWATRPGWVELRNLSVSSFDMSGMRLSATDSLSGAWSFPSGTIVEPGGYLLVWCDSSRAASTASSANLNSGFALADSSGGGVQPSRGIYLFSVAGQRVAFMEWGQQPPDYSIGLESGTWKLLAAPTPGFTNAAAAALGAASALRINEWAAAESVDWIEIYNPGAAPVSLTGLYLSDDPSELGRKKFQVGPLAFIGPAGYSVFYASDHPENGTDHAAFSIASGGEYLRLSANDASATVIDAVSFGLATAGASTGRIPDGAATVATGLPPTPRGRNASGNGPSVYGQPESVIAVQGSNAIFAFSSTGQGPLTITWKKDGNPIPQGAGSKTLTLNGVTTAQEGGYSAAISNGSGNDATQTVTLTVVRSFAQWAAAKGIPGAPANGDYNGDGIPNLLEFFHNLDPATAQSAADRAAALPQVALEPAVGTPTYLTLTYRRNSRASVSDVAYELSPTLGAGTWVTTAPAVVENLAPDASTGDPRVRVKFLIPGGETKRFARLKVVP